MSVNNTLFHWRRWFSAVPLLVLLLGWAFAASAGIQPKAVEIQGGDNLWNVRCAPDYDRGHDNYGPVPPYGFDVEWSPVFTRPQGNGPCGSWRTDPRGRLQVSLEKDTANWFWTYLYVDEPTTLVMPYSGDGESGTWINGNYNENVRGVWPLEAGWNLVEITLYDQMEGFTFDIGAGPADMVNIMDSGRSWLSSR